jgi:hypothetical protein
MLLHISLRIGRYTKYTDGGGHCVLPVIHGPGTVDLGYDGKLNKMNSLPEGEKLSLPS